MASFARCEAEGSRTTPLLHPYPVGLAGLLLFGRRGGWRGRRCRACRFGGSAGGRALPLRVQRSLALQLGAHLLAALLAPGLAYLPALGHGRRHLGDPLLAQRRAVELAQAVDVLGGEMLLV